MGNYTIYFDDRVLLNSIVAKHNAVTAADVKNAAGNPVQGVSVTFVPPGAGASGVFSGSATVTTGANGIATAPAFTANGTSGSYFVTATTTGGSGRPCARCGSSSKCSRPDRASL